MAIKTGIRTLLLAQSSITTLAPAQTVKGINHSGIFVEQAAQGFVPPFIVISDTSFDPMKTLDGTSGMVTSEIDIDCFEATEPEAEALAKAVSDYLKDYAGAAGGSDTIDAVLWDNKQAFQNLQPTGKDDWQHAVTLTFSIQHH